MSHLISARACPVCTGSDNTHLFRQDFAEFSTGSLLAGYDLVVCNQCGAAYADHIPEQSTFDLYYAEMSKYEYANHAGRPSVSDQERFREIVDLVGPHLKASDRLLDIGCATGGLLAEFKARGFDKVFGVDPSPVCARLAGDFFGIPAVAMTIKDLPLLTDKADAVFLTGVLEHVREVDVALSLILGRMESHGILYIEVPDASRYDRHFGAPYQLLSMEHVNYFSPTSLCRLLSRHGCAPLMTTRVERSLSPSAVEPCVGGLFRRGIRPALNDGTFDEESRISLEKYLAQSAALEARIHQKIAQLADQEVPLAVWGAGTHTLRLLRTSPLARAKIVAFIDSNPNYQGKMLNGVPIISPDHFTGNNAEVLISTQIAEASISNLIKSVYNWPCRVHCLYDDEA